MKIVQNQEVGVLEVEFNQTEPLFTGDKQNLSVLQPQDCGWLERISIKIEFLENFEAPFQVMSADELLVGIIVPDGVQLQPVLAQTEV